MKGGREKGRKGGKTERRKRERFEKVGENEKEILRKGKTEGERCGRREKGEEGGIKWKGSTEKGGGGRGERERREAKLGKERGI
jgi:hypothetical protein